MKQVSLSLVVAIVAMQLMQPPAVRADEGIVAGVDIGGAIPQGAMRDRTHTGGAVSPFIGYMINSVLGIQGQAQFVGFPEKNRPGIRDGDSTLALGFHAGPRIALPFNVGSTQVEPYATWQGGIFTGLVQATPLNHTSWGYSTGGGLNLRLTDELLMGGFARYNWVDQRIVPGTNLSYITVGLNLTYNLRAPEPPPAPVAQAEPAPTPAPAPAKRKIVLRGVNFDFDKSNIRSDARPVLDEAVNTLQHEGGIAVIAEGHTDARGTDAYNMELSQRRAAAVRDYLVGRGIAPTRITTEGFGESRPVASNDTDDGRAQNRRVELRIRGE